MKWNLSFPPLPNWLFWSNHFWFPWKGKETQLMDWRLRNSSPLGRWLNGPNLHSEAGQLLSLICGYKGTLSRDPILIPGAAFSQLCQTPLSKILETAKKKRAQNRGIFFSPPLFPGHLLSGPAVGAWNKFIIAIYWSETCLNCSAECVASGYRWSIFFFFALLTTIKDRPSG